MKYLRVVVFCLLFTSYVAQAKTAGEQLSQLLSRYQSLTARFEQTIADEYGNTMQQAKGNLAIKRPDQLRWFTAAPTQQLIITNGHRLWIYDIDLEQVTIENAQRLSDSAPAMLLSGSAHNLQTHFRIITDNKAGQQYFKLTPKGNDDLVQWIELAFQQGKIRHMRVMNQLDQMTELDFSQVELNPRLRKNLFGFNPPNGVDIIDNSNA